MKSNEMSMSINTTSTGNRPFTTSGSANAAIVTIASTAIQILLGNDILNPALAVSWILSQFDSFNVEKFISRKDLDEQVNYIFNKLMLVVPASLQYTSSQNINLAKTFIASAISSQIGIDNINDIENAIKIDQIRLTSPLPEIKPDDLFNWPDKLDCMPSPSNTDTQVYGIPSGSCNSTYVNAYSEFYNNGIQNLSSLSSTSSNNIDINLSYADLSYVLEKHSNNSKQQSYNELTLIFIILFLVHVFALFIIIGLYK